MAPRRRTPQLAAIVGSLEDTTAFRSAQEIHDELVRGGHRVGLATVYRTLQSLADAGEVDVLRNEEGETIYRRCDSHEHHHHLVCRGCGVSVELRNDEIESWASAIARRHGFREVAHVTELFGTCQGCS